MTKTISRLVLAKESGIAAITRSSQQDMLAVKVVTIKIEACCYNQSMPLTRHFRMLLPLILVSAASLMLPASTISRY